MFKELLLSTFFSFASGIGLVQKSIDHKLEPRNVNNIQDYGYTRLSDIDNANEEFANLTLRLPNSLADIVSYNLFADFVDFENNGISSLVIRYYPSVNETGEHYYFLFDDQNYSWSFNYFSGYASPINIFGFNGLTYQPYINESYLNLFSDILATHSNKGAWHLQRSAITTTGGENCAICIKFYYDVKSFNSRIDLDLSDKNWCSYFNTQIYENTFFLSSETGHRYIFNGLFYCQGHRYEKIFIDTIDTAGLGWVKNADKNMVSNSTYQHTGFSSSPNLYRYIAMICFVDERGVVTPVVLPQMVTADNGNSNFLVTDSLQFTNSDFSNITICKLNAYIGYTQRPNQTKNMTWLESLMYNVDYSYISGNITHNVGVDGGIGLISTAFNGLTGLFAIAILPGITLGLLLFLPLVVTIIFAIIKVIKK